MDEEIKIPDWLQPGMSFTERYVEGKHPKNIRVHIRAIVDQEYIVWCYWSFHKQNWRYSIDHCVRFTLLEKWKNEAGKPIIRNIRRDS